MLSIPRFTRSLLDALDDEFLVYPMDYLLPRSFHQAASAVPRTELAVPSIRDNKYNLSLDLRHFDPSEIKVKFEENGSLQVSGKREKKSEDGKHYEYREYVQHFTVPDTVQADKLQCQLDKKGFLNIEAPLKQPQVEQSKERTIPIEFVKK